MRRREFITVLGGAAVWPVSARAQQPERVRRIGVLLPGAADDVEFQTRVGAFQQGLQQAGWTIGRNVRIDTRWATTDAAEIRRHAAELAAAQPATFSVRGCIGPQGSHWGFSAAPGAIAKPPVFWNPSVQLWLTASSVNISAV